MDIRLFQSMLDAGMRWEARDRRFALIASAFPHMERSDQQAVHASLTASADGIAEGEDDSQNLSALDAMRDMAKLNARMDKARGVARNGV
jgi:hypothetical protein